MNKDWTNKMRESLKDCQVNEPDGLWDGVQAGLDHGAGSKVRPLFWLSAASVAAAAAVAALLYLGNGNSGRIEGQAVADADFGVVENMPSSDENQEFEDLMADVQVEEVRVPKSFVSDSEEEEIDEGQSVGNGSSEAVEAEKSQTFQAGNLQTVEADTSRTVEDGEAVRSYWDAVSGTMDIKQKKRRLSLMACVGSVTKGDSESFGGYGAFLNSEPRIQLSPVLNSKSGGGFGDWSDNVPLFSETNSVILANLDNKDVRSEMNHHQPIRYSLEVEYMFARKLGVVTGLSYSRLLSDMTSGSEISSYTVKQKMDYLGIPLALSWHMVDKNRFGLYARFGGMGEKALSGVSVTAYDHGNGLHDGDKRRFGEDRLQWSVASSIGASVGLWKRFSLFAEPGVSCYFENGSDVDNIYKERPLNFNLTIGVRASLSR